MSLIIFLSSLLWSSLIALSAVLTGGFIVTILSARIKEMNLILIPLLVCFFIPPIAIGYGYTTISCNLIQFPFLHKCLYAIIMAGHLTGPASIILFFIPPALSAESRHCIQLQTQLKSRNTTRSNTTSETNHKHSSLTNIIEKLNELKFLISANLWRYTFAYTFIFTAAFNEFELASIMNIKTWSVNLFDAHAQGISFLSSLTANAFPFITLLIISITLLYSITPLSRLFISDNNAQLQKSSEKTTGRYLKQLINNYKSNKASISFHIALVLFLLPIITSGIVPFAVIIKSALKGGLKCFLSLWMLKEMLNSLLFATSATIGVYILIMIYRYLHLIKYKPVILLTFLPLLIGSLSFSLLTLQIFQLPPLHHLYNSPVPLIVALILQTLPLALLLSIASDIFTKNTSQHTAGLTLPFASHTAGKILWKMHYQKTIWILFFIFTIAYFNFTAATILAPVGMTTVTERFYNLMHYGESEKLSATILVTIIIPLIIFTIFTFACKFLTQRILTKQIYTK